MSNIKAEILDKIDLKKDKALSWLLDDCINTRTALNTMPGEEGVFEFKYQKFLKEYAASLNGVSKSDFNKTAVDILVTIFDEFDINVSPEEAFIIFNLKDLGKFRTKDKKLLNDLKGFWGTHKEYALEDSDFNETLRELKNVGLIDFRRGAITLPENLVIKLK